MAYDRYDTRNAPRDERSRWSDDDRFENRGRRDERGFFERAGDEVASWFGDDEAERRRREDQMRDGREGGATAIMGAAPIVTATGTRPAASTGAAAGVRATTTRRGAANWVASATSTGSVSAATAR